MKLQTEFFAILALTITGCASLASPAPMGQPYFTADQKDSKSFQALAARQEQLATKCIEANSCDHVYFMRALLGLYESREVAEQYFRKVIAVSPKGHLAASSKSWMQLLKKPAGSNEPTWGEVVLTAPALADANASLTHTADRLVRELLDRELIMQQLKGAKDGDALTSESLSRELSERDRTIDALSSKKEDAKLGQDQATVTQLRKQIAERDKKIAELSSKLEALKRIDQETREKVRPIRPPSVIAPAPLPDIAPSPQ
jgi:hypothetical protein